MAGLLTASLSGGTLYVEGTEAADYIRVDRNGDTVTAAGRAFNANGIGRIVVSGLGGGDSIFNNTSIPSTLDGGNGSDTIYGGNGDDVIIGGTNNDFLYGRNGSDYIYGGQGNDQMWGGLNDDFLYGGIENDIIAGEGGNDSIWGEDGSDQLYGNDGNDTIWGGAMADSIFGGWGNDILAGDGGDDYIRGEGGSDQLYGNDGNDTMYGDNAGNLWGGEAADSLFGGRGNDIMAGEGGDDYLQGDGDSDQLYGNDGNDTIYGDNAGNLWGFEARDSLFGGWGNDRLFGEGGDDYLAGEGNNDTLNGGDGADRLFGGEGNDGLFGGVGWVDVLNGGSGADRFLQRSAAGAGDEDSIQDSEIQDAIVAFRDTAGQTGVRLNGVAYNPAGGLPFHSFAAGTWTNVEIVGVDVALGNLHNHTGNTRLLKTSNIVSAVSFLRVGMQLNRPDFVAAGFNNQGRISMVGGPLVNDINLWTTVYHEIGHNWDQPVENARIAAFRQISDWRQSSTRPTVNHMASESVGDNWWCLPTAALYNVPVNAANRSYSRQNPLEDFATAFETYFASTFHGTTNGNNLVRTKHDNVDLLMRDLRV